MRTLIAYLFFMTSLTTAATKSTNLETVILDVRTKAEYDHSHVVGAKLIDFTAPDFAEQVKNLNRNTSYKVYCAAGRRAGKAEQVMRKMGFKKVENLGGIKDAAKKLTAQCEGESEAC